MGIWILSDSKGKLLKQIQYYYLLSFVIGTVERYGPISNVLVMVENGTFWTWLNWRQWSCSYGRLSICNQFSRNLTWIWNIKHNNYWTLTMLHEVMYFSPIYMQISSEFHSCDPIATHPRYLSTMAKANMTVSWMLQQWLECWIGLKIVTFHILWSISTSWEETAQTKYIHSCLTQFAMIVQPPFLVLYAILMKFYEKTTFSVFCMHGFPWVYETYRGDTMEAILYTHVIPVQRVIWTWYEYWKRDIEYKIMQNFDVFNVT